MEAGKPQDLQNQSARPKRTSSLIPDWVWRPKIASSVVLVQRLAVCFSLSSKTGKGSIFQLERHQAGRILSWVLVMVVAVVVVVSLFVLFRISVDWMRPIHIREGNLLNLLFKRFLIQKHLYKNTQKNVWPNTWHSMAWSSWHIKLTIIIVWLLNNKTLNYKGALIHRFFSITTVNVFSLFS